MEKKRSSEEKIKKMQELGIFEKWQANTDACTREMYSRYDFTENYIKSQQKRGRILLLDAYAYAYAYLSDVIESSFVFVKAPEGPSYWCEIVGQLREEI